jgi:aspartyl-tRNA(Asn)/glutamyl-tRNA(Gln) amidotransferase subunit A
MGSHSTHSFFGPVSNALPFDKFSAGGSSGGSAAAVASGQCSVALGTDTGGSVRLPAAYTGVIGFKPSYGAISRWGVVPYANSMDTVGIIASDITSIKQAFYKAHQHDPQDPTSLSTKTWQRLIGRLKRAENREARNRAGKLHKRDSMAKEHYLDMFGVRIGVPLEYNITELEPGVLQAWNDCLVSLQDRGATIVPISLPNTKHALSAYYVLAPAEAASNLSKYDGVRYGTRDGLADGGDGVLYSRTRGDGFGDEVKRRILLGSYTLSSEAVDNYFLKAQKVRRLVQRDFDRIFAIPNPLRPPQQFDLSDMDESILLSNKLGPTQVDYIICPTAPTLPPTLDDVSKRTPVDTYMNDVFTAPASLAGIPAISIPFPIPEKFRSKGKPSFAGMQIIGQYASDYALIKTVEVLVNKPTPTESKSLTPETTAPELEKRPIVRVGRQAPMSWLIAKHDKLGKSKKEGWRKATVEKVLTLKYQNSATEKGRDPVLEDDGLPIRKIATGKGNDLKTEGGELMLWRILSKKERALVPEKNSSRQPVQRIENEIRKAPGPDSEEEELPSRRIAAEKGRDQIPDSEERELQIRRIAIDKRGDQTPYRELQIRKILEEILIHKFPSNKGALKCNPHRRFTTGKRGDEIPDRVLQMRKVLGKLPPDKYPTKLQIRKVLDQLLIRKFPTEKGNLREFERKSLTDKEVNKVIEDVLASWEEKHWNY